VHVWITTKSPLRNNSEKTEHTWFCGNDIKSISALYTLMRTTVSLRRGITAMDDIASRYPMTVVIIDLRLPFLLLGKSLISCF
jgi:hypothetical protein